MFNLTKCIRRCFFQLLLNVYLKAHKKVAQNVTKITIRLEEVLTLLVEFFIMSACEFC